MCRRLFAVLCALALGGGAQAQVFKSSVSLVTVDVTVLDRDGHPVPGLTADDFTIKLNGKVQPIRAMSWITTDGAAAAASGGGVPDAAMNVTGRHVISNERPAGDTRIVVIAVDDVSFPSSGGKRTLKAAREFVDGLGANVLVGLMTTSGAAVVNPTLDHAAVTDALSHIVGAFIDPRRARLPNGPTLGIAESIDIVDNNDRGTLEQVLTRECQEAGRTNGAGGGLYAVAISAFNAKCAEDAQSSARLVAAAARGNTEQQISALVTALSRMKRVPGLKQMVLLSEGIGATRNIRSTIEPVGRAAAEAGVQLNVLMEDEETIDLGDSGHSMTEVAGQVMTDTGLSNRLRADKAMFRASLETLADVSGGTFETVLADARNAFTRAAAAGSAVYRLGVEAPADVTASKAIRVSATVSRPDVAVHANRQAVLPEAAERDSLFGVPLRVAVARRRASAAQMELAVGLEVPASTRGPVTMTFTLVDRAGVAHKGSRPLLQPAAGENYRLTFPIQVAPGDYTLRVAVTDADRQVGSVETTIDARLSAMGPVEVSDVLTWWIDQAGQAQFLALDRLPTGAAQLGAGLEIYPRAGAQVPADLKVRLSLTPVGQTRAVAEQVVRPRIGDHMVRAEALLPIGAVPAGQYVLRAEVAAGATIIGEASACIQRK